MYRAKITRISNWVERNYNLCNYKVVKDSKGVYIELPDEREAAIVEQLNDFEEARLTIAREWHVLKSQQSL